MRQLPSCWIEECQLKSTLHILKSLARDHLKKAGHIGVEPLRLLEEGKMLQLIRTQVQYPDDADVSALAELRQGLAFFQKLEDLDVGIDKKSAAKATFFETEAQCAVNNNFFREYRRGSNRFSVVPRAAMLYEGIRRKIRHVLGKAPSIGTLKMTFGPGATTDTRKESAAPVDKLSSGFQCSSSMLASGRLPEILREFPHWVTEFRNAIDIEAGDVPGESEISSEYVDVKVMPGRLSYAPKSALTYRTIIVEPNLNSMFQQGCRREMEQRMRRAGLPINDQTINQRLARLGSIDGSLSTADLTSASDLDCYEFVKLVLPSDWFELLNAGRTGSVLIGKEVHTLEKFSSMGNAYTFPLETLLFWAISRTAMDLAGLAPDATISVFGDDIIIPTEGFTTLEWALSVCGFNLNRKKSFSTGYFRESCGHDYYRGINIRPYYQKKLVSPATMFTLHNFYYRKAHFHRAARVKQLIPDDLRLYGPDGYGDGHLLSEVWGRSKKSHLKRGFRGKLFDTFSLTGIRKVTRYPCDYISPLYSVYVRENGVGEFGILPESSVRFTKNGRALWPYPGTEGYKRVSIYTLG